MTKPASNIWRTVLLWLALLGPGTGWTYSCTLNVDDITAVYSGSPVDVVQYVDLRCRKDKMEEPKLWRRLQADTGSNPTSAQPFRAVRLGGSTHRLAYALMRNAYPGVCSDTTDWLAPGGGSQSDVMWGFFEWNRYAYTELTHALPFCLRILGPVGPMTRMPAAGAYHDQFRVTLDFPEGWHVNPPAPITLAIPVVVHVASHCRLEQRQERLNLHYTSFSREDGVASTQALLACSEGQHWSATIDPPQGTLLGLDYTLSLHMPNTGAPLKSGVSTGMAQQIDIVGRIAAGQAGTCGTGECTARQTHTLTIAY